jgi:hypothetical protein
VSSALDRRLAALEAAELAHQRTAWLADHATEQALHVQLAEAGVFLDPGPAIRASGADFWVDLDPALPTPSEQEQRCIVACYLLTYAHAAWELFAAPGGEARLMAALRWYLDLVEDDPQRLYDHTLAVCRRYDLVGDGA